MKLKTSLSSPAEMLKMITDASIELIQMTSDNLWEAGSEPVIVTEKLLNNRAFVMNREKVFTADIKGHLFGFAGCSEKEYLRDPEVIDRRISQLNESACEKIIFFASWGNDNAAGHSIVQEAMAHRSVKAGADLVIGDHKGLLQGIDFIENVPVIYSLGSLLDGSTVSASKAKQGILVRAVFGMEEKKEPVQISVIPILPCGHINTDRNAYCPVPDLNYSEAASQIMQIWNDTADQIMDRIAFRLPDQ